MIYILNIIFLYISISQINAQPTIGKTTITELSTIKSNSNNNSKHDPLIFIRNPIEAEVPSHWIPQPVLKVIMETQREDKPVNPKIHSTTVKVPFITNHHDVKLYANNITTQKSSKLIPLLKHLNIPEEQPAIDSGPVSDVNSESEPQENEASGNAESVDSNGGNEEIYNSENSNQEDVDADQSGDANQEDDDGNQEDDDANQEDDDANLESGDANQDDNNEDNDDGSAKSGDEESVAESEESIEVTEAPTTKRRSKKRVVRKLKRKPRMFIHANSRN